MERRRAVDRFGEPLLDKDGHFAWVWDPMLPNRKAWFYRFLHWISQGWNMFLGGHEDLTFSQRVGGWLEVGYRLAWLHKPIDFVFGRAHCARAWHDKV